MPRIFKKICIDIVKFKLLFLYFMFIGCSYYEHIHEYTIELTYTSGDTEIITLVHKSYRSGPKRIYLDDGCIQIVTKHQLSRYCFVRSFKIIDQKVYKIDGRN